jgi:hypothetical protein
MTQYQQVNNANSGFVNTLKQDANLLRSNEQQLLGGHQNQLGGNQQLLNNNGPATGGFIQREVRQVE